MFNTARWRLTVVFTGVVVVLLLVAGIAIYFTTSSLIYRRVDAELADKAQTELFLTDPGDHGGHGPDDHGAPPTGQFDQGGYFYAVSDTSGNVSSMSYDADDNSLVSANTLAAAVKNGSAVQQTTSANGEDQRVYALLVDHPGQSAQVLQIGRSIDSEQGALSELRTILLVTIIGSIIPALTGGYLLSGRALRPIRTSVDAQRAFVADASHELRTPVAVVKTNAELLVKHLQSGKLGQSPNDALAIEDILGETDRMAKLVSQMLTLAQVDAGQQTIAPSPMSLGELADEVGRSMRALADAKQLTLDVRADPAVWVEGQRDRLREVLVTLVDNAIKYTDAGGRVVLAVERRHRKAVVTVSDTGAGIPSDSLKHIFERFYRVDKARTRDEGGTGLGLAIARHMVAAHGGDIRIDSDVGKGTRITIELRLLAHEVTTDEPLSQSSAAN
ncbi:MAG: ATP-binding protein [Chloroflexota bacterium]